MNRRSMLITDGDLDETVDANGSPPEKNKALTFDTLVAGLAHELGNPLDGVRRYVNLALMQSLGDPLTKEYLLRAKYGISRMVRILRDLLVYSKGDCAGQDEKVELHALLEESLDTFVRDSCAQGILVRTLFSSEEPLYVNRGGLPLVLQNLFKNASQAMNGSGTLTVATWRQKGRIGVSIKDTGGGIPAGIQTRIFEPFFTSKNAGEGMGIGLTLSRSIVERSGGEMHCENISDPTPGACFTITLPRALASSA